LLPWSIKHKVINIFNFVLVTIKFVWKTFAWKLSISWKVDIYFKFVFCIKEATIDENKLTSCWASCIYKVYKKKNVFRKYVFIIRLFLLISCLIFNGIVYVRVCNEIKYNQLVEWMKIRNCSYITRMLL